MTRVLFLTPDLGRNSLGRTYCLDLLAAALGWKAVIRAPSGESVWAPLAGTPFARRCGLFEAGAGDLDPALVAEAEAADLIIAVKPLPGSFGVARRLGPVTGTPVVLDVDDPDLDAELSVGRPHRRLAKMLLRRDHYRRMVSIKRAVPEYSRMVSNPVLQRALGGELVPHVRLPFPDAAEHRHTSTTPRVVFVGTNRSHKGVPLLRSAVGRLADEGFRLVVTDERPADAAPHEDWIGRTSFEAGLALVREADIVALPSRADGFSRGQLPAKLIDAMMAGAAIVVSDVDPMPWAVQDAGLVVPANDEEALVAALRSLRDPAVRERLGRRAADRALDTFTVEAVLPAFTRACDRAMATPSSVR